MICNQSILAAVVDANTPKLTSNQLSPLDGLLCPDDELAVMTWEQLAASDQQPDVVFVLNACGSTPLSDLLVKRGAPVMTIGRTMAFHPYHTILQREIQAEGGLAMPTVTPETVKAGIEAVRARRCLRNQRLIVAEADTQDHRLTKIQQFSAYAAERLGVQIIIKTTSELQEVAASFSDQQADSELKRWYAQILQGPGDMEHTYMQQAAKLYLAQRQWLNCFDAVGITISDIKGFLHSQPPAVMPNITYGPLVFDGYMATEEADIGVLTTELLLHLALGAHPTMSNLYYAYRDQFATVTAMAQYTPQMELADCRQCLADHHITAAHYGASGILPPNMMLQERYAIHRTIPVWPNQATISATPQFGPVVVARLSSDVSSLHAVEGEIDGLGLGEQYGWYRGRWFIRLPDARQFADRMLHQHYAICPKQDRWQVLQLLAGSLLGLKLI